MSDPRSLSAARIVLGFVLLTATFTGGAAQENNTSRVSRESQDNQAGTADPLTIAVRDVLRARLGYPPLPYASGPVDQAAGSTPPPARVLTLDELINAVDRYHPKLRGAEVSRRIAGAKTLEKQGAFDPVVFAGYDYLLFNADLDPKTLRGKSASSNLTDAGIEFLTRSGLKVAAGARYNLGKIKAPLSPTGDGGEYFLSFKMPLLRGFRINEKAAAEQQAQLGEPLAEAEYQLVRLELLSKATNAYWDWVAARQKLEVAQNLLQLARFRAGAVRDRVRAGDLPEIDGVEADLEVQRREGGQVKADRDLQKTAFKLSLFLWSPNGLPSPLPQASNAPVTIAAPVVYSPEQAEFGQRVALDRRPELKALAINNDITAIDLDLARNQKLPALDLVFSPGRDTGLGSIGNTIKAGASFSLPLRQRTAEGRILQANLKIEKLGLDLANERQKITTEVLDAISAINTSTTRYRAALAEVELARQLEEGERTRFELGDSTLFLVNQRERATAEARLKLIDIQAEYEQAVAAYRVATVQF